VKAGLLARLFAARKKPPAPPPKVMPSFWRPLGFDAMRKALAAADRDPILMGAGLRRRELRKLTYDDEICQACQTREDGLLIVPVRLEPTESEASRFIAERCLTPERARTIVSGAFKAKLYGYSVMEIVWDREAYAAEGALVPLDVSLREMDAFTVRPDGTLILNDAGMEAMSYADPALQRRLADVPGASSTALVVDTRRKFLLTRNEPTWDNPWGEALLSRLWWPWFFRQQAWNFFGQYLERFAIPLLWATGEKPDDVAAMLAKAQQDAVIGVRTGDQVNALNANAQGADLYARTEEMLVRRIEKVILGQTLTSGTDGGSGNRALGQVHNAVRGDKTKADIELVRPTVQRFVDACFELNGLKGDPPEVVFGDDRQLARERADRDAVLKQSGMVGGYSADYLMDNYGFRPGEIEMPLKMSDFRPPDEVIEVEREEVSQDAGDGARADSAAPGSRLKKEAEATAAGRRFALPTDMKIEALALRAAARAGSPLDPEAVRKAILESETAGEMLDRLSELEIGTGFAEKVAETGMAALKAGGESVWDE
jgi:hypothetical protein